MSSLDFLVPAQSTLGGLGTGLSLPLDCETHDGRVRAVVVTTGSQHCPAGHTGAQGVCVECINA